MSLYRLKREPQWPVHSDDGCKLNMDLFLEGETLKQANEDFPHGWVFRVDDLSLATGEDALHLQVLALYYKQAIKELVARFGVVVFPKGILTEGVRALPYPPYFVRFHVDEPAFRALYLRGVRDFPTVFAPNCSVPDELCLRLDSDKVPIGTKETVGNPVERRDYLAGLSDCDLEHVYIQDWSDPNTVVVFCSDFALKEDESPLRKLWHGCFPSEARLKGGNALRSYEEHLSTRRT